MRMGFEMCNPSQTFQSLQRRLAQPLGALVLAAVMLGGGSVQAAESRDIRDIKVPPGTASSFAPAPGISIEKATAIARKHTGGRVLSATPKTRSSGTEYRIRMLVDGERVTTVVVDHQGRIKKR